MSMILKMSDHSSLFQESFSRQKIQIQDHRISTDYRLMEKLVINFDLKSIGNLKLILVPTQVSFFFSLKSRVIDHFG